MKLKYILPIFFFFSIQIFAQKKSEKLTNIQIARDTWGVPHIYAPTDKEVAYGLAWAQCEDDFKTMQEQMLAIRGNYGEVRGKEGLFFDFGIKFMGLQAIVEERYEKDLSPEFREILDWFVEGVNSYAALHSEEVLLKKLFPLKGQDVVKGYLLGLVDLSGARNDLIKILEGKIDDDPPKGSNAIAISRKKTMDGKTYLAINSHQPLEGWYSWYEAHLVSEEGWNILGGTFPGGVSIFHGANENLGWAQTVNHPDLSDIFELKMHPKKKNLYRFDGKWLPLKKKKYKSKLKLGFLKIPIFQKIYESKYGPTFKTDKGFYSWRYVANMEIRGVEQWYRMNKAQNFDEFKTLLDWQGIICTNLIYADREDNIYYLSNGKIPVRDPNYHWRGVLPGDTSATLWTEFLPNEKLPQVLNPESGYVFNMNNTPFNSSGNSDNPKETELNKTMGYRTTGVENNRSTRFMELINQHEKLTYQNFKNIKYDDQYPSTLTQPNMVNLELLMSLNPRKYPDLDRAIDLLQKWDRKSNIENPQAAFFIITIELMVNHLKKANRYKLGGIITESDCVLALEKAQKQMLDQYGKLEIPLGEVQKHIRGEVSIPLGGAPDVLRAMYSQNQGDGTYKGVAGESYIELVRFSPDGVELETVNVYGASAKEGSPHFTDQMDLFAQKKLKTMSLDWEKVLKDAVRVYSPERVLN